MTENWLELLQIALPVSLRVGQRLPGRASAVDQNRVGGQACVVELGLYQDEGEEEEVTSVESSRVSTGK
jgi:hypothetical protein